MLTSLRNVDEEAQIQGNPYARLSHLGYQLQEKEILAGNMYLRFYAQFDDASELTGYIDLASWLNQALPALEGIDWLSVDEQVLPALIAAYPLKLELINQHAPLKECRILELQKNLSRLASLQSLGASTGTVLVENFTRNLSGPLNLTKSNVESLDNFPVLLVYFLGSSVLPVQYLAAIKVGDVLLIEQIAGRIKNNNKTLFEYELGENSLMILENNDVTPELTSNAQTSGEKNSLDNLQIELSIVLMEKTVTLSELKTITPGEIVTLSSNVIMDVEIRANQRSFARGELIQLTNGQLGVEIRKIEF